MNLVTDGWIHFRIGVNCARIWWNRRVLDYLADTNPDLSDCGTFARFWNTPRPTRRRGRLKRWLFTIRVALWIASNWPMKSRRA